MVRINKQYLVKTKYTNYKVNIIYNIPSLDKRYENDFKYLYDNAISYEFNLGGSEYCSYIGIYSKNNTEAHISEFKYNSKCNIGEDLKSGIGTKHLLNTAMSLIALIFPKIKIFYLNDTSNKSCHTMLDKPIRNVNLGFYSILFYKNTWYGRIFNAKLEDINLQKKLNGSLSKLSSIDIKLNYDEFKNRFLINIPIDQLQKYLDTYNIELLYNKTNCYYDFFESLKQTINNETELCIFMSYFIIEFMLFINDEFYKIFSAKWMINVNDDKFDKIDIIYPLEPIVKLNGGYRNKYVNMI